MRLIRFDSSVSFSTARQYWSVLSGSRSRYLHAIVRIIIFKRCKREAEKSIAPNQGARGKSLREIDDRRNEAIAGVFFQLHSKLPCDRFSRHHFFSSFPREEMSRRYDTQKEIFFCRTIPSKMIWQTVTFLYKIFVIRELNSPNLNIFTHNYTDM